MAIEVTTNEPAEVAAKPADAVVESKAEETPAEVEAKPGDEVAADAETETEETSPTEEADGEELEAKALDDEENPEDPQPKKKKMGGFQRRERKLREEVEFWKTEAMKPKAAAQTEKVEAKPPGPDLSKRPKAEDFEKNDDYVEALADWKLEAKLKERDEKQRNESIKREVQTRVDTHMERIKAFEEEHDDFQDVVEKVSKIPMPLAVQETILDSDIGPAVIYELAKDPKEYKRICSLRPLQAAKEIGKIEARLSKSKTSETPVEKKTTKAPEPVKPVKNRGTTVVKDIWDPNIEQREFNRIRNEQERARLAGR